MEPLTPPIAVERGIQTLITDAISLAIEAEQKHDNDLQHTLARASIISSAFFLEACANSCIDMLGLGTRFSDEVDKLPTIAKFDLFLQIRFRGKKLDRSRTEYQGYSELKILRDSFVHPRAQRYEWIEWSEDSSTSTSPRSKYLGLAKIPAYCYSEDAVIALQASHRFASYFFKDCCGFRPKQVSALFHSEDQVPSLKEDIAAAWPKTTKEWLISHDINLNYMRIHWY